MATIQFDEDSQYERTSFGSPGRSWLSNLVIKTGLAKDNAGAQHVLLISAALFTIGTILIAYANTSNPRPASLSSQLIIKSEIPVNIQNEIPPAVFNSLPAEFYLKDLPQNTINQLPNSLRQQLGI